MLGIRYSRLHATLYRIGFVVQMLGMCGLAVLYPINNPFYTAGIMLFELGVLLSGIYLLVWISWIKKIILNSAVFGILLQIAAYNLAPEQYAVPIMISGVGFVCVAAAVIVGKEAFCCGYREGWMLIWLYPIAILINLSVGEIRVFNSVLFASMFLLHLSLSIRIFRHPLLASPIREDSRP